MRSMVIFTIILVSALIWANAKGWTTSDGFDDELTQAIDPLYDIDRHDDASGHTISDRPAKPVLWSRIAYGDMTWDGSAPAGTTVLILGARGYTAPEIHAMTQEERIVLADAWASEYGPYPGQPDFHDGGSPADTEGRWVSYAPDGYVAPPLADTWTGYEPSQNWYKLPQQGPFGNAPITEADWAANPDPRTWGGDPVRGADRDLLGFNRPSWDDPNWNRPGDFTDPRWNEPRPHGCDSTAYSC